MSVSHGDQGRPGQAREEGEADEKSERDKNEVANTKCMESF